MPKAKETKEVKEPKTVKKAPVKAAAKPTVKAAPKAVVKPLKAAVVAPKEKPAAKSETIIAKNEKSAAKALKSIEKGVKVSAFAEALGLNGKDLLNILQDLGVEVKSVTSTISEENAQLVKDLIKEEKESRAKAATPAVEAKVTPAPAPVETTKAAPKAVPVATPVAATPAAPVVPAAPVAPAPVVFQDVEIDTQDIMVKDLSEKLGVRVSDLIKELMRKGAMATINQRIDFEMASQIAEIFNKKLISTYQAGKSEVASLDKIKENEAMQDEKSLLPRAPVVTIMGHVDHGKTKLLDAIRSTNVVASESGGITQHIGAYQVEIKGKKVTFLDTPGHAAFTALRARGANVTDIVVLVVAADDGVMPQTIEALDHAKAAGVPIMVAINKIDKPEANPDRVKQQLSELGLTPEEWGGKTVMVPVSARQKTGIETLLEMILLIAEVQELKANPHGLAQGVVVESKLEKGRGPIATVLIRNGTIKLGDPIAVGATSGKVRALINDKGGNMKSAGPATPVEIIGLGEVPAPGDLLTAFKTDREARDYAEKFQQEQQEAQKGRILSLEDFSKEVKKGERKDLNLILKTDVNGSLEAIAGMVSGLNTSGVRLNIIHQGVGTINENDIVLAQASGAIVIGFHVTADGNAAAAAEKAGVNIRIYDIIYKITEDLKLAADGLLEPVYEEVQLGEAEVRATYKFSKVGVIAGAFVTSGKMVRGAKMRIFRGGEKIYEGKLEALKRFKDDVREVETNFECGISVQGYEDFAVGDKIQAFEMRKKDPMAGAK